ncbi:MAG TPA: hypothetical protein VEP67_03920 [Thiobacillaceae bacterium]|nr:hypothetical protein [Thiobacillaceae bacterium]
MKAPKSTAAAAMLVAGILGAYAWAPAYSASQDSGKTYTEPAAGTPPPGTQYPGAYTEPAPGAQSGAQSPGAQSPAAAEPAEKIMPGKSATVCARLDKNRDGYISLAEFRASGKPKKLFKSADVGHRGKLNMEECSKALSG